ncbi:MAG: hypothetical protein ABIJ39_09005 [Chloroflexota bacterium]
MKFHNPYNVILALTVILGACSSGPLAENTAASTYPTPLATHSPSPSATDSTTAVPWNLEALGQIVYQTPYEFGNSRTEILIMDADGSNQRPLRTLDEDIYEEIHLAWSPDGGEIAFNFHGDIYIMSADGSELRNFTDSQSYDDSPAWSPDGQYLAYASTQAGVLHPSGQALFVDIYTIRIDGSDPTRLTSSDRYCSNPAWSPSGEFIAYDCLLAESSEIYIVSATGAGQEIPSANIDGYHHHPAWSPDGRSIAFTSSTLNGWLGISIMEPDGSNVREINTSGSAPTWSPDSRFLAMNCASWDGSICIFEVDTGELRRLDVRGSNPAWSPAPSLTVTSHPDFILGWSRHQAGGRAQVSAVIAGDNYWLEYSAP